MSRTKQLVYWNIPVPKSLDKALEDAVYGSASCPYVTKSDFVRDAVREKLEWVGRKRIVLAATEDFKHE
jgi:Arc/MetJ-type ribon-helix-helix transcriptional regulator